MNNLQFLKSKKNQGYIVLTFFSICYLVLMFLPVNFFDDGPALCLSKLLLDKECPGCGMTRGIQRIIHFQFTEAMEYNKLSIIVFPLSITAIYMEVRRRFFI